MVRGFFCTPEFLRENGIPYFTFVQGPKDLVFTFPGVAHQVVNTKPTVCEAKNIMPLTFSYRRVTELICDCPASVGGRVLYPLNVPHLQNIPGNAFCEACGTILLGETMDRHREKCSSSSDVASDVVQEGDPLNNTCNAVEDIEAMPAIISESDEGRRVSEDGFDHEFSPCPEFPVEIPDIPSSSSDVGSGRSEFLDHTLVEGTAQWMIPRLSVPLGRVLTKRLINVSRAIHVIKLFLQNRT